MRGQNKCEFPVGVFIDNVSVSRGGVPILESINASVPRGEVTGLIGPNGSGKTTLLLAILNQISYSGRISFGSQDVSCKPRIGYVPQRFQFDRGMPITVLDFMTMGNQSIPLWFGTTSRRRKMAEKMLAVVQAQHLKDRRLGALSGGELQRVLLALALLQEPELLILDEPVAGMDIVGEQLFCDIIEQLRKERGFTQLMVSHNLSVVLGHASHAILLNRRVICEGNPHEVLKPEMLLATYGMHLEFGEWASTPLPPCPHCTTEKKT